MKGLLWRSGILILDTYADEQRHADNTEAFMPPGILYPVKTDILS